MTFDARKLSTAELLAFLRERVAAEREAMTPIERDARDLGTDLLMHGEAVMDGSGRRVPHDEVRPPLVRFSPAVQRQIAAQARSEWARDPDRDFPFMSEAVQAWVRREEVEVLRAWDAGYVLGPVEVVSERTDVGGLRVTATRKWVPRPEGWGFNSAGGAEGPQGV